MTTRSVKAALVLAAFLACCSASSALASTTYQGSIGTPTVSPDGRTVTAPITMTATCDPTAYCGFFPIVTTVPDSQTCSPAITGSTWVGSVVSAPFGSTTPPSVAATAMWSEYPSLYAGGKRACLYTGSDQVLVAQTTYAVPAPTPEPTPTPLPYPTAAPTPVSTPAPQNLSAAEARGVTRRWMKRKFGRRWTRGFRRKVACPVRTSTAQLGCYAVWIYRSRVYSREIVITETETSYLISNSFLTAPPQDDSTEAPSSGSGDFCSTHVCIPNYANGTGYTVECRDGTYSHSGGEQGACSHHGGVASTASVASTSSPARQASRSLTGSRRLARNAVHRNLRVARR